MLELDLSADIQALRSTFADIKAVVDVEALTSEIARLSEEAGAPDLWDDVEKAQKVTSTLSHRQAALKRVADIEQRLDDLDVLVELANEMDDEDSAEEARQWGLINRIVPSTDLMKAAREYAEFMAKKPFKPLAEMKARINAVTRAGMPEVNAMTEGFLERS